MAEGSAADAFPTSSTVSYRYSWDVFLSFRGDDTRHGFPAHLYDELVRQGVRVFRDDEGMERGDEIAQSPLLAAIQDSAVAIAVISERYASSKWCLEELARILECKRLLLPVFYNVDPSDVRWQKGTFAADFRKLEVEVATEKVERWRNAMKAAGNISGWDSRFCEESELIKILVKKVMNKLNNTPLGVAKYPVGLDRRLETLLMKLDVKGNDVRVIGFYGMGGIGKTTLAKALYNKLAVHFKIRSFISSVREISQQHNGLAFLQRKFLGDLKSGGPSKIDDTRRGICDIKQITHNNPILLVLDDVDNFIQLDGLAGGRDWFHNGSRIIITSRDKEVLTNNFVDEIYEVKELTHDESVQLFSYHAFGRGEPTKDFMKISEQIVSLSEGLPLALEAFGSLLFYKRRIKEWHDVLEKLKRVRPGHLQDKLEISFRSLDEEGRCIFLDLACFFVNKKMKREDAIDVFKGCGFNAETAITDLTSKSLVKIIDKDVLWMHEQLRDMGREIVRRESYIDAGQRSRLWDQDEILKVLKNEKGTRNIEGITLDFEEKHNSLFQKHNSISEKLNTIKFKKCPLLAFGVEYLMKMFKRYDYQGAETDAETLCTKAFKPMLNLRLLQINHAKLDGNFKFMPSKLKWLQWKGCPLKTLPFQFCTQDLGILDLSESKISQLWSKRWWESYGKKIAKKLLVINLHSCRDLQEIPDLSGLCLEKLILEECSSLVKIHESIGDMSKLTYLNLKNCKNLVEFPRDVCGLKCLEELNLSGCTSLRDLPEVMTGLQSLKILLVDGTAIVKLPDTIFCLENLEVLNLNQCKSLTCLPSAIGHLRSLRELCLRHSALLEIPESLGRLTNLEIFSLEWCESLTSRPDTIGELKSLSELFLDFSSIMELPESIGSLCHLKFLSISHCKKLIHLPKSIGRLSSLATFHLEGLCISEVPEQIGFLKALEQLKMGNCTELERLPDSIGNLLSLSELFLNDLSITELPESLGLLERLHILNLNNCKNLQRLPASIGNLNSLQYLVMAGTAVTELPTEFGMLSNLRTLNMRKEGDVGQAHMSSTQAEAAVFPVSFSNLSKLEILNARACKIFGKISDDFEKLSSLQSLDLGYNSISSLPSSLSGLSVLEKLLLPHCKELKSLPPLPSNLLRLNVSNCSELEHIPDISNLENLEELELTNCDKVTDIPGLEQLRSLRRLYIGGCNACLSSAVKKRISKVALRYMRYLCVPGSQIPNWFTQEVPNFSNPRNRKLKGVIIGVVVSLDQQQTEDGFRNQLPAIVDIQAKIVRLNKTIFTTTLYLLGIPNTGEDQLYLCRFPEYGHLVSILEDGDMLQVTMRETPYLKGITLKKHGIHLVFENDDDYEDCDDALFSDESQQSVSKRLSNFLNSL